MSKIAIPFDGHGFEKIFWRRVLIRLIKIFVKTEIIAQIFRRPGGGKSNEVDDLSVFHEDVCHRMQINVARYFAL